MSRKISFKKKLKIQLNSKKIRESLILIPSSPSTFSFPNDFYARNATIKMVTFITHRTHYP